MKKAVFFDIDGTLWNEKMQVPESTVKAVRQLREKGIYAFICTGRSRSNVRSKNLLDIGFDGMVASCGTHIEFQGEKIFEVILDQPKVKHALNVIKKHKMSVVLEGPRYIYVDEEDFLDDPYVIHLRKELGENIKNISGNKEFEINKMSVSINGASIDDIQKDFGDDFDLIVHNEWLVEINPKGYSKAIGIEKVCDMLGIERENTYAFGDSANDLEMLSFVAHGVAMGNATKDAKEVAEFITTDIDEDGIYNGLVHYGLI